MIRVRNTYLVFVAMFIVSAIAGGIPELALPALQGLALVLAVSVGLVVVGIRRGLATELAIDVRRHCDAQMSILILLVVGGIGATFQILVRFGDYGVDLHAALLLLNWCVYSWAFGWVVLGLWRSQVALLKKRISSPAKSGCDSTAPDKGQ